jgi:hypothetical protein
MRQTLALALFVCPAFAQIPSIGSIDYYGLHKLTPAAIEAAAGIKPGGTLPPSEAAAEEALEKLSGVVQARVEAVCCQGGDAALFIGIEERGAPHAAFRSEPSGEATLPENLTDLYEHFLGAVQRAAAHGNGGEDLTAGHSVMNDLAARGFQPHFVEYATGHLDALRSALHESSDSATRAAAAAIIGYGPQTQQVVDDLQFALSDPEPTVRTNAIRSLEAFIVYASKSPSSRLQISATWFVELLHSVELSDREESAKALVLMTNPGSPSATAKAALDLLRERALPDLAAMARWSTLRYALPPYLLLGRSAGLPEDSIQRSWTEGERESVIQASLGAGGAPAESKSARGRN